MRLNQHHTRISKLRMRRTSLRLQLTKGKNNGMFGKKNPSLSKYNKEHPVKGKLNGRYGKTVFKTTRNKISISYITHNYRVSKLKKEYINKGYKVLSCFDIIPDLIIKRGNKISAIEVERNLTNSRKRMKIHNYKKSTLFDNLIFIDIRGKRYE